MAENQINIKIDLPFNEYERELKRRSRGTPFQLSYKQVEEYINKAVKDETIREELLLRVRSYPNNAYRHFLKNIAQHAQAIKNKRIKNDKSK